MSVKSFLSIIFFTCITSLANAQTAKAGNAKPDPSKPLQVVEISCGQCKFHLKGKSCDLDIRINGKAYFVDGAHIDEFGDAHAGDGFCKAIRKAEVQGEITGDRFRATYIKLLPL